MVSRVPVASSQVAVLPAYFDLSFSNKTRNWQNSSDANKDQKPMLLDIFRPIADYAHQRLPRQLRIQAPTA